jgi:hypothetical protein
LPIADKTIADCQLPIADFLSSSHLRQPIGNWQSEIANTQRRLTKHLPGNALISSLISNDSNAEVKSDISSLLLSINESMCVGLSGVRSRNTDVSNRESPLGTKDNLSGSDFSFFSPNGGGSNFAAI